MTRTFAVEDLHTRLDTGARYATRAEAEAVAATLRAETGRPYFPKARVAFSLNPNPRNYDCD